MNLLPEKNTVFIDIFFSYVDSIKKISYNTERWWSSSNALDSTVVILLLDRYLSRKFIYIPI